METILVTGCEDKAGAKLKILDILARLEFMAFLVNRYKVGVLLGKQGEIINATASYGDTRC